jgi:hypothetical protein
MPTLCVWNACRVPCISAFSVSSNETTLGRWCTRQVRIPCETAEYPFARSVRHFMKYVSFSRFHNFQVGSTQFSILITKATTMILTFRYSTQCTEAACLNITCRQRPRTSVIHAGALNQNVLHISLSFAILLHVYALCHLVVLDFKQDARKSSVKKNI